MDHSASAILAEDLVVRRGGVAVLHGLGFEVPVGQIVGLLGPSGSGKSSLIRTVVGVQQHVEGRCDVLGLPAGTPELRRRIGYVTQAPAVYTDLTVRENLRYFAVTTGADRCAVDRALEQVDLTAQSSKMVNSLSGGQWRRVSLAVALLARPDLLVLDEPTVGLDPVLRQSLWQLFRQLASTGVTLLVSSHVMDEASECDRLLLLRDGHLLSDGTEAELLARTGAPSVEAAFLALVGEPEP